MAINVTETLLDAIFDITQAKLSEVDDHQVRRCLLDYLGCAVGGSSELHRLGSALALAGAGKTLVLGTGLRTSVVAAAFANGFCSHVLELDDGHRRAMQHLGAPVFSVLLSLCDECTSWDRFSKAVICGYEVAIALGEALQPQHKLNGFHATGTCGTVGATAAACVLLGYDRCQIKRALGAAATSAAGLLEVIGDGSGLKPYNVAHACMAAVMASGMGHTPYDGPMDVLGGKRGLLPNFGGDASRLTFSPTRRIHGIYVKPYAACRHCHSPIECAERICSENVFSPDDVADVRVDTYELAVLGHDQKTVANPSEAKMSTPFGVASVICGRGAYTDAFTQKNIDDENIRALMGKVRMFADATLTEASPEKRGARVSVVLRDGERFEYLVEYPKGEPENPITDAELERKAYGLFRTVGFSDECTREVITSVWTTRSINKLKLLCCKELQHV